MNLPSASKSKLPIVVLISGNGSNLQAIIDATMAMNSAANSTHNNSAQQALPVEIQAVISNRDDAYGLERARKAGIHTVVLKDDNFTSREAYDQALLSTIEQYHPQLIVLAGFMRILSDEFVTHYSGKMINIHPSLLPKFRGLNTHQRAIDAGEKEHGATVHFVTPELDGGPAIVQSKLCILPDESAEKLAERVLALEHQIYPLAIRWIADSKIEYKQGQVFFESKPIQEPVQYTAELNNIPAA